MVKFTLLKHTVWSFIFRELDNHCYHLIPEHFHHLPKEIPYPFSPPSVPDNHWSISYLCKICLFRTFHRNEIIQCVAFCGWLLSCVLQVHPRGSPCQYSIPVDGCLIFQCMERPHLVYPSSPTDGHLGCFPLLVIMNNTAIKIHVHGSVWACFQVFGVCT